VRDPLGRPLRTEERIYRMEEHSYPSACEDDGWADAEDPTFLRLNATADQADLLGIPPGEPFLTRAAIQQSNGVHRMSPLYLPFSVAEHTPWAENPHLPTPRKLFDHFLANDLVRDRRSRA
jgi:GntR family transcriptional regulator